MNNDLYLRVDFSKEINSILSKCRTNEEAIQKVSEKPENLVNFFEVISDKDHEWHLKESINFLSTFKKINELNSANKFDQNQINRISKISTKIYPLIVENETQTEVSNFLCTTIKIQTGFSDFLHKELKNQTGIEILEKENILNITITNPEVNLEELTGFIDTVSKIYSEKSIKINLEPKKIIDNIEIIK